MRDDQPEHTPSLQPEDPFSLPWMGKVDVLIGMRGCITAA